MDGFNRLRSRSEAVRSSFIRNSPSAACIEALLDERLIFRILLFFPEKRSDTDVCKIGATICDEVNIGC